jgi:hypothetical protein
MLTNWLESIVLSAATGWALRQAASSVASTIAMAASHGVLLRFIGQGKNIWIENRVATSVHNGRDGDSRVFFCKNQELTSQKLTAKS